MRAEAPGVEHGLRWRYIVSYVCIYVHVSMYVYISMCVCTCEQVLGEGGVAVGERQLRVRVLIPIAVTAEAQVCPRAKYGAIAARKMERGSSWYRLRQERNIWLNLEQPQD